MDNALLQQKCVAYLHKLCMEIPERCVGSEGNRKATQFFKEEISSFGWKTETQEFDAMDWEQAGAGLTCKGETFEVFVSPYSLGCDVEGTLLSASSVTELEALAPKGGILLLHGDIAKEQLMPKNFVFYNPEEHQHIISLLEKGEPQAILCATGRNASLAGGAYPFPLIEDGDFNIPSVYMKDVEGLRLLPHTGETITLRSVSKRIMGKGENVIARKGKGRDKRIVVTAHIDAKKGTPGAIDNATGVIILLLLARLMEDYKGDRQIEIVALNGEDYYAAPGQMRYLNENREHLQEILFNLNIDGAGYREGRSAFSFYEFPQELKKKADEVIQKFIGIIEGPQWYQGDHSIFIQNGRPAIAVSSVWFTSNIDNQEITHTPKDQPGIVDCQKVVEIAEAINLLLRN
jgi:aminopeptidase YwaD